MSLKQIVKENYLEEECEYEYNNKNIFVIKDKNNAPWFRNNNICNLLGYVDHRGALRNHVQKKNRKYFIDLKKYITVIEYKKYVHCDTLFINKEGLLQLITSSKMTNIDDIAQIFGVQTLYRYKRKEIEIVDELKNFLDELKIKY